MPPIQANSHSFLIIGVIIAENHFLYYWQQKGWFGSIPDHQAAIRIGEGDAEESPSWSQLQSVNFYVMSCCQKPFRLYYNKHQVLSKQERQNYEKRTNFIAIVYWVSDADIH